MRNRRRRHSSYKFTEKTHSKRGMAMLVSVITLVIAAGSLREEDSFKLFPRLGLGLAIISMGCWIGTYAMGVYIL